MNLVVLLKSALMFPEADEPLPGLSPGDRAALGSALALATDRDEITAISAGPERENHALEAALMAGAHRAFRISDPIVKAADQRTVATVLAGGLRQLGFDLILAGQRSANWGSGGTGPALAHLLRIPHVTAVHGLERADANELLVIQQRERVQLELLVRPPALLAVAHGPWPSKPAPAEDDLEIENISLAEMTLPFRMPLVARDRELLPVDHASPAWIEGVEGLVDLLKPWR